MKNKKKGFKHTFENFIIERNTLNTVKNNVTHLLCLIIPVAAAFCGYFISKPLWKLVAEGSEFKQWFAFMCSLILFGIAVIILFVKTRNTNSVIRIRVLKEKETSEKSEESAL